MWTPVRRPVRRTQRTALAMTSHNCTLSWLHVIINAFYPTSACLLPDCGLTLNVVLLVYRPLSICVAMLTGTLVCYNITLSMFHLVSVDLCHRELLVQ